MELSGYLHASAALIWMKAVKVFHTRIGGRQMVKTWWQKETSTPAENRTPVFRPVKHPSSNCSSNNNNN